LTKFSGWPALGQETQ